MKSELTLIPSLTIHPGQIYIYSTPHWEPTKPQKRQPYINSIEDKILYDSFINSSRSPAGKVSPTAKRKITKAIDYLLMMSDDKPVTSQKTGRRFHFKVAFITLTLPSKQIHSDNEIKRTCLNSFLIELQKYHKVKRYVWRAEKQKNGSIHFHIIIDKFVHYNDIRNRWNRIVNKLGYVDRYRDAMREFYKDGFKVRKDLLKNWNETAQRKVYHKNLNTGWHSPNSTDIHSIRKIFNLGKYFVKYMTKNQEEKPTKLKMKKKSTNKPGEFGEHQKTYLISKVAKWMFVHPSQMNSINSLLILLLKLIVATIILFCTLISEDCEIMELIHYLFLSLTT